LVGGWEGLVVAYEAAESGQPGEAAFHDPAAVEQDEALGLVGRLTIATARSQILRAPRTNRPVYPASAHTRVIVENASRSAAVMR
jgi:hypothetical protein